MAVPAADLKFDDPSTRSSTEDVEDQGGLSCGLVLLVSLGLVLVVGGLCVLIYYSCSSSETTTTTTTTLTNTTTPHRSKVSNELNDFNDFKDYDDVADEVSTTTSTTTTGNDVNDRPTPTRTMTVYHATPKENIPLILGGGFRFPTLEDQGEDQEDGRRICPKKLGCAVYFGNNKEYCLNEAENTLADSPENQDKTGRPIKSRTELRDTLRLVEVVVDISRVVAFGDYGDGFNGKRTWPLAGTTTTDGKPCFLPMRYEAGGPVSCEFFDDGKSREMTRAEWEMNTEMLSTEYLEEFGFDTVTLNDKKDSTSFELAVFKKDQILSMRKVHDERDVVDERGNMNIFQKL